MSKLNFNTYQANIEAIFITSKICQPCISSQGLQVLPVFHSKNADICNRRYIPCRFSCGADIGASLLPAHLCFRYPFLPYRIQFAFVVRSMEDAVLVACVLRCVFAYIPQAPVLASCKNSTSPHNSQKSACL